MKIKELIERLEEMAHGFENADWDICPTMADTRLIHKAAEVIELLWEVAKDTTNAQYKRQIDEWRGEDVQSDYVEHTAEMVRVDCDSEKIS